MHLLYTALTIAQKVRRAPAKPARPTILQYSTGTFAAMKHGQPVFPVLCPAAWWPESTARSWGEPPNLSPVPGAQFTAGAHPVPSATTSSPKVYRASTKAVANGTCLSPALPRSSVPCGQRPTLVVAHKLLSLDETNPRTSSYSTLWPDSPAASRLRESEQLRTQLVEQTQLPLAAMSASARHKRRHEHPHPRSSRSVFDHFCNLTPGGCVL